MHTVTLRLDRVFDVVQDAFSDNLERTLFSFESSGQAHLSVRVDGLARLQDGQTITAVLGAHDDWQALLGLRVHETGEIFAPHVATPVGLLFALTFVMGVLMQDLMDHAVGGQALVVTAYLFMAFMLVRNAMRARRIRQVLRASAQPVSA